MVSCMGCITGLWKIPHVSAARFMVYIFDFQAFCTVHGCYRVQDMRPSSASLITFLVGKCVSLIDVVLSPSYFVAGMASMH